MPTADVENMVADPGEDLLVQERLVQHPAIRPISPWSLNTARLLAVRVADGEVVLAGASHRWGTAVSGPVDNVSAGGIASGIDARAGRLGPIREFPRERRRVQYDRHPDTGEQVAGVILPQWEQVRDLALRLMATFPELDHVGWDIAVTDQGPRVIEGNAGMPALMPFQQDGPFVRDDERLRHYYIRHGLLSPRFAGPGRAATGRTRARRGDPW